MKILKLVLVLFTLTTLSSCGADDEPAVTSCFEDTYNGTYSVIGTLNNSGYSGDVTFEKLSCTTAKFVAGSYTENISELEASGPDGYIGKTSEGVSISIGLTGNTINVVSGSKHNFSGDK